MESPVTLAIDIGGTGLKASSLGPAGNMLHDRVRTPTTYPLAPSALVSALEQLVAPLPSFDRVSVAFPGVVRRGCVLTAPHFVTVSGPGSRNDPALVAQWNRFDLGAALDAVWHKPVRVLNDADLQGLGVVRGEGVEVVITLGTGLGTACFEDGRLGPHLELAHHPFHKGETYNEQLGDAARKRIGNKRWNKRVDRAISTLRALTMFDHLYVGGGNVKRLALDLPPDVSTIDPDEGLLGGLWLWDARPPAHQQAEST